MCVDVCEGVCVCVLQRERETVVQQGGREVSRTLLLGRGCELTEREGEA